ncbi:MAG: hypothetical protein NUV97_00635 [archaeon]|nr:hypothetical protein [archaeon]
MNSQIDKQLNYLKEQIFKLQAINIYLLDSAIYFRLNGYSISLNGNGLLRLYKEEFLKDNRNRNLIFILEAGNEIDFLEQVNKYDSKIFNY